MDERQLDLFAPAQPAMPPAAPAPRAPSVPSALSDDALIAALAAPSPRDCVPLAAEAGRRKLARAVPPLAALCRRFTAWGDASAPVPEQAAALDALNRIGGRAAASAIAEGIAKGYFIDPTLALAVATAARLDAILPEAPALRLLRHDAAPLRAEACRCVPATPAVTAALMALFDDLHPAVVCAAACALGRQGRAEALRPLLHLLETEPTEEVIEALGIVADEDGLIRLSRLGRREPRLAGAVLDALETRDHPRAEILAAQLRAQA